MRPRPAALFLRRALAPPGPLRATSFPLWHNLAPDRPARVLFPPDGFQNLDQTQIDLPSLHIHAHHLDEHLVAESIDAFGVLAAQHMLLLDEAVVVVGHARDVYEPFNEMLDELDEEPIRSDAGDVAVELVADLVRHEADLLPLQQLAFRLVCPPLPLGRVPRDFGKFLVQFVTALIGDVTPAAIAAACDARRDPDTDGWAR